MAVATQHQYRVMHGEQTVETYTQEEAVEIARRIALEQQAEVSITDSAGKIKARVFPHQDAAYVDYYLNDRIAVSEAILHGKPRIASGRVMVQSVLDLLAADVPIEEIIGPDHFPDLTREDVLACIEYASSLVKKDAEQPAV